MAQYTQLVAPRTNFRDGLGYCLRSAQSVFGAPARHRSATHAGAATVRKQYNRNIPTGAAVLLWFDHWGSYDDGLGQYGPDRNRPYWGNWGHVVVHVPGRGYFSSPDLSGRVWFSSIPEVERAFGAKFRFWTDNINGLRVAKPAKASKPKKKGLTVLHYARKDANAGRMLAPGRHCYLHTTKGARASQASNVVGGIGPYSITTHLYAEGTPGDAVDLMLMWQKGGNSFHYRHRAVFDRNGRIYDNAEFKRAVPQGYRVFVRAETPATNQGSAKLTLLASDAYLIK